MLAQTPSIITSADEQRIRQMIALIGGSVPMIGDPFHSYLRVLENRLKQSRLVAPDQVSPDVVTMNSQVSVHEMDTCRRRIVTLVYPSDAGIERVSVLTPLGRSLLGARAGETIEWNARRGPRQMRIEKVLFQPEAAGRFEL